MLCAAFRITALLFAVPYAYDALRLAGAAYLLWLRGSREADGRSPFQVRSLRSTGPRKLFADWCCHQLFNPKIVVLYLALLPQFHRSRARRVLTRRWRLDRSRSRSASASMH